MESMKNGVVSSGLSAPQDKAVDSVKDVTVLKAKEAENDEEAMVYGVDDNPPIHMSLIFGLQQVLLSLSSTISIPLIVADKICAGENGVVRAELVGTFLVMCGFSTFLQCTFGTRLPIIQGGCHKFIPAVIALMSLDRWKCPERSTDSSFVSGSNMTGWTPEQETEIWQSRMREIQGNIILASLVQVVVGSTGLLGFLLRFIGPLTIVPTITLVGLSMFEVATNFMQHQWFIALATIIITLIFSLYLSNISIPLPSCNIRPPKCYVTQFPIFKLLPVILSIAISWLLCGILTATNTLPQMKNETGYYARTDARSEILGNSKWFFFPYPGQWGVPTVSTGGFLAMLTATFCSIIESVGDYHACARASQVPPPPAHAVNRGILLEGVGSILSGAYGSGGATTSYSQNVGAIGFTKVASRRAFQAAALLFIVAGVFGKLGALLSMMPNPVLGGAVMISFGMVTAVGLANLQFINLASSRNQVIIGLSLMMGMAVPNWLKKNPKAINTGNGEVDQVFMVLLSTSMFVGGLIGFILDNTVPGSDEDRGILKWREVSNEQRSKPSEEEKCSPESEESEENPEKAKSDPLSVYHIPLITKPLNRWRFSRYIPIFPQYKPELLCMSCRGKKTEEKSVQEDGVYQNEGYRETNGLPTPSVKSYSDVTTAV